MRLLGDVAKTVLAESRAAAQDRATRLREQMGDEPLHEYLTRVHGHGFAAILPAALTLDEYLGGSSDYSEMAASERLKLCLGCDGAPARCAGRSDQLLEVGQKPTWDRGHATQPCPLYAHHVLRWKLQRCGVPKSMLDCSLDTFQATNALQKRTLAECRSYVADFRFAPPQENGLLIVGSGFGIGKTHLAIGVMRALVESGLSRRPMFLFVPAFLEAIRRSYDEPEATPNRTLLDRAKRADLLVLDDLGAERTTEWVQEQLTIILNARWSDGLATVVTTNAGFNEIKEAIGGRAYSRLWGCMGRRVLLQGKDRRRNG